jgi:uncharacterized tellurite resistance protein B-like protein
MSFDIIDIIEEATKEADAFENHPVKELSIAEQILYLNGLGLVMNADGEIHNSETEYLRILIKSIGLDESILQEVIKFSTSPDKDTVQEFFQCFKRKPINQLFLFDALAVTRRDGKVDEKETKVVNVIADKLEILKGTQKDIFDLFCHITHKNWEESSVYFSSHLLNPKHFKHLLDYHSVNFDDLMNETKALRDKRLSTIIQGKSLQNNGTSIFTHEILIPHLQSELDRGAAYVVAGKFGFNDDDLECSLQEMGVGYCSEENLLFLEDDKKEIHVELEKYLVNKFSMLYVFNEYFNSEIDIPVATLLSKKSDILKFSYPVTRENRFFRYENEIFFVSDNRHSEESFNLIDLRLSGVGVSRGFFSAIISKELFDGKKNKYTVEHYENSKSSGYQGAVIYRIDKNIVKYFKSIERHIILNNRLPEENANE